MKLDLEVVVVANECYDILLNGCTKLQRIFLFSIINSMAGSKGLVVDIKKKKKKFYTYLNLPLGYIAFKNNFSLTFFKQSFFFFGSYLLLSFFLFFYFYFFNFNRVLIDNFLLR